MSAEQSVGTLRKIARAKKALRSLSLRLAIDPLQPDSRPTPAQDEILTNFELYRRFYVLGGNRSGKTALLARVVAWFFTKDHPYIDLEKKWPNQPLLILVVSRTSEQYTDLWETKIRPFLTPGTYKEEKGGGTLLRVRNKENGTKIIFQSHHNPSEAREKVQYFAAHLVALDEQTDNLSLLEELVRRTTDNDGYFFNAMTPKMPAPAVKKYIEKKHRLAKIYKLKMLDNPKMRGREQDIIDDIANLPADMQATILEGDWYQEYGKVYAYQPDIHQAFPEGYSVSWRHAEAIDPAASGKVGFGIAAEDPRTGQWTIIKAKYLKGEAASDLLDKIEMETLGLNITHHVSDPHETWFIKEAFKRKRRYIGVNKDGRKEVLIKGVSEALKAGWLKIAPAGCAELEDELYEAEWSPNNPGKILNSTRYHLLDMLQYFVDTRPKFEAHANAPGIWVALDKANKLRKLKEAKRRSAPKHSAFKFRPAIRFR